MKSVEDYDPRWLQLWRDASEREIELPIESRQRAVNLRQRLYILRQAMKAQGHPFSDAAQKAKITIEFLSGSRWLTYTNDKAMKGLVASEWRLRMIPHDQDYDSMLERAGYKKAPQAPNQPDWERIEKDLLA